MRTAAAPVFSSFGTPLPGTNKISISGAMCIENVIGPRM
jgi:Na+/H+ antiporter NhaC